MVEQQSGVDVDGVDVDEFAACVPTRGPVPSPDSSAGKRARFATHSPAGSVILRLSAKVEKSVESRHSNNTLDHHRRSRPRHHAHLTTQLFIITTHDALEYWIDLDRSVDSREQRSATRSSRDPSHSNKRSRIVQSTATTMPDASSRSIDIESGYKVYERRCQVSRTA